MAEERLIGLVYNSRLPEAGKLATALVEHLGLKKGSYWLCSAVEVENQNEAMALTSLVISLGGDGTILRTARVATPHSVPILGINLGRVGFMTELKANEALEKVSGYINGETWVEERAMLQAVVFSQATDEPEGRHPPLHALNDVVVSRGAVSRLIDIEARVDGALVTTYRADGLIVSTATGSTGYALSVGGPILYPQVRDIVMKPVAAHLSLGAGLVLPDEAVIELTVLTGHQAVLSVDGFVDLALARGDRVKIQGSAYKARFLRAHPPSHFYATLVQRLGLGRGNNARASGPG